MLKKIYNYFFKSYTNSILANIITAIFGEFISLGSTIDNDIINDLSKSKSKCLSILYNSDDVEYIDLIDKIRYYAKKIYEGMHKFESTIKEKDSIIEKLTNEIDVLNKNTYLNIDPGLFKTISYKELFLKEKNDLESQNASEDVILNRFNNLINQETIYLQGILDAIEYAKNKKSKSKSIYLQLEDAFLVKKEND